MCSTFLKFSEQQHSKQSLLNFLHAIDYQSFANQLSQQHQRMFAAQMVTRTRGGSRGRRLGRLLP